MNNLRNQFCLAGTLTALSVCSFAKASAAQAQAQEKLNVIFILTDDQGYGDLGCHGNPWIQTPNIDQLHSESVRFTDYHSGTTSAPTRSGIMTGHYGNTTGVWHTIQGRSILDLEETTLADAFKNTGYATAMFGKWHLGDNYPNRPQDRGFDQTFIHGGGGVGQTPDYWENDYFDDTYLRNGVPEKTEGYCTDVWFSNAIDFIEQNKQNPFFCYISTNAPHSPYHVADEFADPYKNNPNIPIPSYYGMVTNLDMNVGILRNKLKDLGLDKNTVLIFMTDNGADGSISIDQQGFITKGYNAGMRGKKSQTYEGGHRVPLFISFPDNKNGYDINDLTAYIDLMPTLVDMCNLKMPNKVKFDGVSLMPLIKGKKMTSRYICLDTQREEYLEKYKSYCVMKDSWRLIDGKELYDLTKDPEQRTNIAEKNPQLVKEMISQYELWWDRNKVRANDYQYIGIDTKKANVFTVHDAHTDGTLMPAWNQELVRSQTSSFEGYWMVNIPEDATYTIDLMRWPAEAQLGLLELAPQGEEIPNGKAYSKGAKLNINGGYIKIADQEQTKNIDQNFAQEAISFELTLKEGNYKLIADFKFLDQDPSSANYVRITKIK